MKNRSSGGGGGSARPKNRWSFLNRGGDNTNHSTSTSNRNHHGHVNGNRKKDGTVNGGKDYIRSNSDHTSPGNRTRAANANLAAPRSMSSSPRRHAISPDGIRHRSSSSSGHRRSHKGGSPTGKGSGVHLASSPTSTSSADTKSVSSYTNQMNNVLRPNRTMDSSSPNSMNGNHNPNSNILTPVGLSGPTNFIFSPPPDDNTRNKKLRGGLEMQQDEKKCNQRQRYMSFLSSHPSITTHNLTATGSPVRTMGGGGNNNGEKRLCVMDLDSIWKDVDYHDYKCEHDNEMRREGEQDEEKNESMLDASMSGEGQECDANHERRSRMLLNTDAVMEECVTPLLNTTLPFDRKKPLHQLYVSQENESRQGSCDTPYSCPCPFSPSNHSSPQGRYSDNGHGTNSPFEDVSDASLSLEEKLRRERQRVHSNGITQFAWERVTHGNSQRCDDASSHDVMKSMYSSPQSKGGRHKFGPVLSPTKRPIPERMPESLDSSNQLEEMRDVNANIEEEKNVSQQDGIVDGIRIIIPLRGNIYMQDGVGPSATCPLVLLYDKCMLEEGYMTESGGGNSSNSKRSKTKRKKRNRTNGSALGRDTGAIDPQLSPDGSMVAFVVGGEIYVMSVENALSCKYCTSGNANENGERSSNDICERMDVEDNVTVDESSIECWGLGANLGNKEGSTTSEVCSGVRRPTRLTYGAHIHDDSDDSIDDDEDWMSEDSSKEGDDDNDVSLSKPKRKFGKSITHGLADFVAQEEMDRYRGFWWDKKSQGIIFVRVDESCVPPYRITHQGSDGRPWEESTYEEHRYPFAGEHNPEVSLGYIKVNRSIMLGPSHADNCENDAKSSWSDVKWFEGPTDASEYIARVNWLPDGSMCVQWQDRRQSKLLLMKIDVETGDSIMLHQEESDIWINLHHMFKALPRAIHPLECLQDTPEHECPQLPDGSFSYIFASERTGFCHLYLYTYIPGDVSATLLRVISAGNWIVESIIGVDMENDLVYFTGTFKSPLEKHMYCLPLRNTSRWQISSSTISENDSNGMRLSLRQVMNSISGGSSHSRHSRDLNRNRGGIISRSSYNYAQPVSNSQPPDPLRLTSESGMHSVAMDSTCRIFVDTCSDLNRPTTTKIYSIPKDGPKSHHAHVSNDLKLHCVLYDVSNNYDPSLTPNPPELLSFSTSDGSETLYAALYCPDPKIHGHGPYPLICNVYGGPHVQRVTRSWCQCADMRIQRLCSMGFAVVKCDNRGSARRGLAFEGAISKHLGRVEVLDQVTAVRHLVMKRIADPHRVGISGWSYGGYLAAMCLCRAPDVFRVGIAGAPVTSWDGYDTHYTERYMGLPQENVHGYDEAAVFEHVPNMRGKLLIIHGLIDENVHFRHTARLINRLIAAGKDYEFLPFPDERHSPRKLRDRIYMEKRMTKFFADNLLNTSRPKIMGHL